MATKRPTRRSQQRGSKSEPSTRSKSKAEPATTVTTPSPERVDGRNRRATGRTLRFGATVHPDWKAKLDRLADRLGTGTMYVQVLEQALDALERELDQEDEAQPEPSAKRKDKGARPKTTSHRRRS